MGKKKHRPEAALIEARLVREREWCYARWMERMTFRQISAASALPIEQGGLGVHLSIQATRNMVAAYREERGDVTMSRDERRERQSDELDELARSIRAQLAKVKAEHGIVDLKLTDALLAIGKREADLHGLAAATEIKAEIVTRSSIDAEIDAMLARMGEAPLTTPEGKAP
jgi:hypothetical protein